MTDRFTFLCEKAENFRTYVLGQHPDSELAVQLDGFKKEMLLPTLTTIFLPSLKAQGLDALVNELLSHLTPEDIPAVRCKLERYLL